jgi:two-component system chemotaxis sensor kinase CheA
MADRYAELFRSESREHLAAASDALLALERGGDAEGAVRDLFRAVHTVKGMAAAMGHEAVAALAHALETVLDGLRGGRLTADPSLVQLLFAGTDALDDAVSAASDGAARVPDASGVLERLRALAGEEGEDAEAPSSVRSDPLVPVHAPESAPAAAPPRATRAAARSVRVDARHLDALLDVAGELVIARGRLAGVAAAHADPALRDAVLQLSRLVATLQHEVRSARLVPVAQLFDRFPRLVRDTARELGKAVELATDGRELQLDRAVLDELADPLVHLIRNALDHGIEPAVERARLGKPAVGRLTLSATREGDTALVRVRDDGRGIDRERVRARAAELGVAVGPAELSDADVARLVSRAGFSTRARASAVSGRGVGVDAVQARLHAVGGTVEIESREGAGTCVTLRVPLTLAIVRALLARVGDEVYALPVSQVAATAALESPRAADTREAGVRDAAPVWRELRALVGLGPAGSGGRDVVVVETDGGRVALVVDELLDEQDVVVKRFDAVRGAPDGFSGATILADGRPALIVDVGRLLAGRVADGSCTGTDGVPAFSNGVAGRPG